MEIKTALTGTEIRNCFPVMQQLRPHLDLPRFVEQVENQMRNAGYVLAYLEEGGESKAAIKYQVTDLAEPNEWRQVRVRVKVPELTARTISGYFTP